MAARQFCFAAAGLLAVAMPLTAQERPREERPRLAPFGWYRFDGPLYWYRDPLTRWDQAETRRQMMERALERAHRVRELRDWQWDRRRELEERTRDMLQERRRAMERLRLRAFDLPRERLLWRPRYRPI